MKNRIDRTLLILGILVIILLVIGCDLAIKDTVHVNSENALEFSIDVPAPLVSRGINNLLPTSYSVWVKVLNSAGEHLPATNTAYGITELSYASSKWSGTVNLAAAASGTITFYVWAQVDTPVGTEIKGEHTYVGSTNYTTGTGGTITIPTLPVSTEYKIGSAGPAGGIVFYENADYEKDGWRYLEAAPSDFSYTWEGVPIETALYKILDGNVLKKSDNQVMMYNYEWYWGPPDKDSYPLPPSTLNYQTVKKTGSGYSNKQILVADSVSGSTPKLEETPVRPRGNQNIRRDLAKTLSGGKVYVDGVLKTTFLPYTIEGFADWYVPSKDELGWMYSNLKANELGSFAVDEYWSSTETYETGDNPPTANGPYPRLAYEADNTTIKYSFTSEDLHAWIQDFSDGAQSQVWRNHLARVRPVRKF